MMNGFSILENGNRGYDLFSLSSEGGNACVKEDEGAVINLDEGFRAELDNYLKENTHVYKTIKHESNKDKKKILDDSATIVGKQQEISDVVRELIDRLKNELENELEKKNTLQDLNSYRSYIKETITSSKKEIEQIIKVDKKDDFSEILIGNLNKHKIREIKELNKSSEEFLKKIDDKIKTKQTEINNNNKKFIFNGGKNTRHRRRRHKITQNHKRTVRK